MCVCVCVDITVAVVAVTNEHTSSHTFADSIDSVTSEGKEEKRAQSKGEWKEFTESERERERERISCARNHCKQNQGAFIGLPTN